MSRLKLGIPMIGGKHWMGGIAYTELLLKALQTFMQRAPEIDFADDDGKFFA